MFDSRHHHPLTVFLVALAAAVVLGACGERGASRQQQADPPLKESTPAIETAPMPTPPMTPPSTEDAGVIGFHGFGPAKFGDDEEAVRMAWGRPLMLSGSEPASCAYLMPDPRPAGEGFAIAFMLVDGRFARYDVGSERYTAPGGGKVGSAVEQLELLYAGRIDTGPHKYIAGGKVLVVTPPDGGDARLVFEAAADGIVKNWRIGVPPGVHYVEGCS